MKPLRLAPLIVAAVALITYHPAIRLNFYGDDYSFVERAGRSSLGEYLAFYFDPRLQTGWYRPMQGMLFGVEYLLFGVDPLGYHVVNVLVHLGNCLLLFALVRRFALWRTALVAALLYAGLPLFGPAVFWPGDADFELTLFYLLGILAWVRYLDRSENAYYIAAFLAFLLALTTKEFGVTLPVVLFLADRLLVRNPAGRGHLARRYLPFAAVWLAYLPSEYLVQSRSVLTNSFGYGLGPHALSNLVYYLASLAFPWGAPGPGHYAWLVIAGGLVTSVALRRQSQGFLFLIAASVLAFLPVIFFPWQVLRYLYMAAMASAVLLAVALDWSRKWFKRPVAFALIAAVLLPMVLWVNGRGVAEAAADFAELGRQARVPLRDIAQRHPTFPEDTYIYFIDPPSPTSELSGMFFVRYGPAVSVESNVFDGRRANLREHRNAYVVYFDEEQQTREIAVEQGLLAGPSLQVSSRPESAAIRLGAPIQLLDLELASSRVKRGGAVVVILYWKATGVIDRDYRTRSRLVDGPSQQLLASSKNDEHPGRVIRFPGKSDSFAVDAHVLHVPETLAPGKDYRLELSLYPVTGSDPVPILDETGGIVTDRISIGPLSVE